MPAAKRGHPAGNWSGRTPNKILNYFTTKNPNYLSAKLCNNNDSVPGNKLKLILVLSLFSLPPAALLCVAWYLSLYTTILNSLGQYLLAVVVSLLFMGISGYVTYFYINERFLKTLGTIAPAMLSIFGKNYKPAPPELRTGDFKEIFDHLDKINNELNNEASDISILKEDVKAQENLLETALSEIVDPVIVLNLRYEVKYTNPSAQFFTGIQKSDALGRRIDQFVRFYDKNNKEILPTHYAAASPGNTEIKIFYAQEVKIVSNINRQTYADVSVFLPPLGRSIDTSIVIVLHDKSQEKQLEAMKLDFVSMAAHELRTPLTSIKGYISVFLNENQNKLTQDQLMFVRRINTSTQQLSGLVENLLSVARVERGAMSLNTQVVDWVSNVKTQVDTFQHRAEEKRIQLIMDEPKAKIPSVEVDLVRINEVLNNLVSNAINYTEPQGKIEIWIEEKDEMVITHVKDTGKGIPAESLARLFTKFFRVQGGPAEQASKGNGLGLYLSKAIVELHNGKIWAESDGPGKGSTFSFSLPAVKDTFDISVLTKSL
jgi:two-component system, OmpR family, phosphate regulon sensor histidine kinase PhoR